MNAGLLSESAIFSTRSVITLALAVNAIIRHHLSVYKLLLNADSLFLKVFASMPETAAAEQLNNSLIEKNIEELATQLMLNVCNSYTTHRTHTAHRTYCTHRTHTRRTHRTHLAYLYSSLPLPSPCLYLTLHLTLYLPGDAQSSALCAEGPSTPRWGSFTSPPEGVSFVVIG